MGTLQLTMNTVWCMLWALRLYLLLCELWCCCRLLDVMLSGTLSNPPTSLSRCKVLGCWPCNGGTKEQREEGGGICFNLGEPALAWQIILTGSSWVPEDGVLFYPCGLECRVTGAALELSCRSLMSRSGAHDGKDPVWLGDYNYKVYNGVRRPRQIRGPKIQANVPPKGPCWRHRVCYLGATVVAWAARWHLGVGRI